MQKRTRIVVITAIVGLAWAATVAAGLRFMLDYERTAGAAGAVPSSWPASSSIRRATDQPTLLVFAHPRCPCTRATVSELAQLIAHTRGKLRAIVVFFAPKAAGADWTDTTLQRSAAAIPGVTVLLDRNGTEAKRFGAETSGHTLLFHANGQLLFSGGITPSRGHEGDNAGENALVALVNGRTPPQRKTLVFGCSIAGHQRMPGATQ